MVSTPILVVVTFLLVYFLKVLHDFSRNLAAAKSSGIPYIIVPIYMFNRVWLLSHTLIAPYLRKLPRRLTEPWLELIFPDWTWTHQHAGFRKIGHDTFLTVSPGGNVLATAEAPVISQITARARDFPKLLRVYRVLNIYGPSVLTTEGQVWRQHRKITSALFTETNNRMVFAESLRQAQAMTNIWIGERRESSPIHSVADDALRLSLHIISQVGFGKSLSWPVDKSGKEAPMQVEDATSHELSYTDALTLLLHNLYLLLFLPRFILRYTPVKRLKSAYQAYVEWGKYLNEMFQTKKEELAAGQSQERRDLMGAMIGASMASEFHHKPPRAQQENSPSPSPILSHSEIIGNSFIFILAGHETTANSIHFSLIYLAVRLSSQRRLQEDLDSIFGSRPISEWDYDRDFNQLFSGMSGAVLAEELRLIPPVINVPKHTGEKSPQEPLIINGKGYHVPPNTYVKLSVNAVQRNPAYWPVGPSDNPAQPVDPTSDINNDLDEFKPERWLLQPFSSPSSRRDPSLVDGALSNEATPDTSAALFRPVRGAYIPFSDGQRACVGRRFAQVEVLTILAVIFKEYSVELALEEFPTTKSYFERMKRPVAMDGIGDAELREVWEQAATEVQRMLRHEMRTLITNKLKNGKVPLRLVRRGEERFRW